MKASPFVVALLALGIGSPAISAAAPSQPPMDQFNDAFYNCDSGGAFQMSYESRTPTSATMTTSNNNNRYSLKRQSVASGSEFSNGTVKFWTDGQRVQVTGTRTPLGDCKLKSS